MPRTSQPRLIAERQAARMTALSPGASPPPVEMAMRIRRSAFQKRDDFARVRVAAQLRFLEDRRAVARDLEASAARRLERDVHAREFLLQLGRQTDGPWLVASNGAVFDFDVHCPLGMPARF